VKILTGLLAVAAIACAQPSFGWSATVRPPQPALPAVDVTLGYGDYVPETDSPIALSARGAFGGMIGYHFEHEGRRTVDPPFAIRDRSLRHIVRLEYDPRLRGGPHRPLRELIIDWRDTNGNLLASASAGKPPWTESSLPARITAGPLGDSRYLGQSAVVLDAVQLPAWPQWYSGLSSLIAPAELWLTLDPELRKAIFHSGTRLNLFGLPGPRAIVLPTDDAILPVTFSMNGVRPKPGAAWLDGERGPRLVQGPKAVWVESEEMLREPLPQAAALHLRSFNWDEAGKWSYRTIFDAIFDFRPMLALGLAGALSLLLGWLARRGAASVAAAIALAAIIAHPLYRNLIRPRTLQHVGEGIREIAPGVSVRERRDEIYGDAPLRAPERERDWQESASHEVVDIEPPPDYAELAPAGQPVQLAHATQWAAWRQLSRRVELGTTMNVTVDELGDHELTLRYDLPHAPRRVLATWTRGGRFHYGSTDVREQRRGRATITRGKLSDAMDATFLWGDQPRKGNAERVSVSFLSEERGTTRMYGWSGDLPAKEFVPYRMFARARKGGAGHVAEVVIPAAGVPAGGEIHFADLHTSRDILAGAVLEGNGVLVPLQPRQGKRRYRVAAADFRRVAREHGLVTIHLPAKLDERFFARAEVVMSVEGAAR
jgi:hypothetical protein